MSLHVGMDCKCCIHPPLQNAGSVGTKDQGQRARASEIFHQVNQFVQSSLLGACTLVIKNAIAMQVLGLAHFGGI
jgi:hypothetical protein